MAVAPPKATTAAAPPATDDEEGGQEKEGSVGAVGSARGTNQYGRLRRAVGSRGLVNVCDE